MKYRFVVSDNKINLITEHNSNTTTATPDSVDIYTGTIDWAVKNLPLLGVDISEIFIQNLAVKTLGNPFQIIDISNHPTDSTITRKYYVTSIPINSDEKFFYIRGVLKHYDGNGDYKEEMDKQINFLADDNTLIDVNGQNMGEYSYYEELIKNGESLPILIEAGVVKRDSEGRFDTY